MYFCTANRRIEMKLHLFNPEHDLSMAAGIPRFTPPHAARQLRADLGFLPALWAADGDLVWVDDVEAALERVRHFRRYVHDVAFVDAEDLRVLFSGMPNKLSDEAKPTFSISPWGWDSALCYQLTRLGLPACYLPDKEQLSDARELSSRQFSSTVLPELVAADDSYVGTSRFVESLDEVRALLHDWQHVVVKAPWSCSGRGVRYIDGNLSEPLSNWIRNILRQQHGVTVEPYYNKVLDFGMEFEVRDGHVNYLGLSLFETVGGAYTGSVLASEDTKRQQLSRYLSAHTVDNLAGLLSAVLSRRLCGRYEGPLGVDMMVVADGSRLSIHPCVEINLRRTMGHVALSLPPSLPGAHQLMRVAFEGSRYHFRIQPVTNHLKTNIL